MLLLLELSGGCPGRKRRRCLSNQKEEETPPPPLSVSRSRNRKDHTASEPKVWAESVCQARVHPGLEAAAGLGPYPRSRVGLQTMRTAPKCQSAVRLGGWGHSVTLAVSTRPAPPYPPGPLCSPLPRLWDTKSLSTLARKS